MMFSLNKLFTRPYIEWGARGKSYSDLLQRLQDNETATYKRFANATDVELNRSRASHIIGIERWSAHRMRTLLGEPLVIDEYDGYRPGDDLSMDELAEAYRQTRAATYALIRELQVKGVALSQRVWHNELGDISLGAWIVYISSHAGRETLALLQHLPGKVDRVHES
jgi:hypothetical protein